MFPCGYSGVLACFVLFHGWPESARLHVHNGFACESFSSRYWASYLFSLYESAEYDILYFSCTRLNKKAQHQEYVYRKISLRGLDHRSPWSSRKCPFPLGGLRNSPGARHVNGNQALGCFWNFIQKHLLWLPSIAMGCRRTMRLDLIMDAGTHFVSPDPRAWPTPKCVLFSVPCNEMVRWWLAVARHFWLRIV